MPVTLNLDALLGNIRARVQCVEAMEDAKRLEKDIDVLESLLGSSSRLSETFKLRIDLWQLRVKLERRGILGTSHTATAVQSTGRRRTNLSPPTTAGLPSAKGEPLTESEDTDEDEESDDEMITHVKPEQPRKTKAPDLTTTKLSIRGIVFTVAELKAMAQWKQATGSRRYDWAAILDHVPSLRSRMNSQQCANAFYNQKVRVLKKGGSWPY